MKNIVEKLPLRINKINGRITMSAPMPGLSPEDIDITIGQQSVLLRGEKRGSSQPDNGFNSR